MRLSLIGALNMQSAIIAYYVYKLTHDKLALGMIGLWEVIPAIGFSLLDYDWNADFEQIKPYIKKIALEVLSQKLPEGTVLNVNFPKLKYDDIKGIKVCRQSKAIWMEKFDKRQTPYGKDYYWLTGEFVNQDKGEDTDEWALAHGYVSIVPVQFDLTAHHAIQQLNSWDL
jgi:5'-nucleotidase